MVASSKEDTRGRSICVDTRKDAHHGGNVANKARHVVEGRR